MGGVTGFDHAVDLDSRDVGRGEGAFVDDLFDAGAHFRDSLGEFGEAAGTVADQDVELGEAAVGHEAVLDHATEDCGVDVATAEKNDDLLPFQVVQLAREKRGKRGGARALDDSLLKLDQAKDRKREAGFVDDHGPVDHAAGDLEGVGTDRGDGEAVTEGGLHGGEERLASGKGGVIRSRVLRLNADNLGFGAHCLYGQAEARNEARAADGDDDGVRIRNLLKDLQTKSALAGDDVQPVETVHVREPFIAHQAIGFPLRLVDVIAGEKEAGTEAASPRLLHQGREDRHHNGDGDSQLPAMVRERERVVTRRGGHYPAALGFLIEKEKGVSRPALLEASRALEVLPLAKDPATADLGECRRLLAGGFHDSRSDAVSRGDDVLERNGLRHEKRIPGGSPRNMPSPRAVKPGMKPLLVLTALAALASVAPAQAVRLTGSGGYGVDSAYNRLYNRSRQIVFTGRVVGKSIAAPMPGMAESVSLIVKSPNGGNSQVELGPRWFVADQVAKINVGDRVKVIGSKVRMGSGYTILARQVVDPRNRVLTLRDLGGAPYWAYNRTTQVATNIPANAITGRVISNNTWTIDGQAWGGYTLETDNGNVQIVTAPDWYMQRQDFVFQPGANITVVGQSRPIWVAPNTYFADTIYGSGVTLVLSNGGVPVYNNFNGTGIIRN